MEFQSIFVLFLVASLALSQEAVNLSTCDGLSSFQEWNTTSNLTEIFSAEIKGDIILHAGDSECLDSYLPSNVEGKESVDTTRKTWTVAPHFQSNRTRILTDPPHLVVPLLEESGNQTTIRFSRTSAMIGAESVGIVILIPPHQLDEFVIFLDTLPSNVQLKDGFTSISNLVIFTGKHVWGRKNECLPGEALNFSASLLSNQMEDMYTSVDVRASHIEIEANQFNFANLRVKAPNSNVLLKGNLTGWAPFDEEKLVGGQDRFYCGKESLPGTQITLDGTINGLMGLRGGSNLPPVDNDYPVYILDESNANVTMRYSPRAGGGFQCISECQDSSNACLHCEALSQASPPLSSFPCSNERKSYRDKIVCGSDENEFYRGDYCMCSLEQYIPSERSTSIAAYRTHAFQTAIVSTTVVYLSWLL